MELKLVKAIQEGVADINLFSQIIEGTGDALAREIKFIEEFENVDEINLHINSIGGSIFEALSITAAMRNSKALIRTINEGVSASIAGIILTAGDEREGVDFGRVMLHVGRIVDEDGEVIPDEHLSDNQREGLKQFNDIMKEILENNTRLSQKDIKQIMESGKDVFFNSVEAKKKGIIDKRIVTKRENVKKVNALMDIAAIYQASSEIIDEKKNDTETKNLDKPKPYKMEKIKALLGLDSTVSEEVVESTISAKLEELKAAGDDEEVTTLKARVKELEDAKAEADKTEATTYVEAKIEAGVYDEKKKDDLIAAAEANLDGFKLQTEAMKTPHASISGTIDAKTGDEKEEGDLEFPKDKDGNEIGLRDLDKADPKALLKIKTEKPDLYFAMWEKQYDKPHADAPEKIEE